MADLQTYTRWMIRADMPAVLAIENQSFDHPWAEDDFIHVLRQRNCIGMVADSRDRAGRTTLILGFMVYEFQMRGLQIRNCAVAPNFRRMGVGRLLANKLIGKLSHRRNRIVLNVRETNLDAQLFFRSVGFRGTRVLRDHYEDSTEDAFEMVYRANTEVTA